MMKKLLLLSALFIATATLHANPGNGGYLGHRVIVGGEFAYAPFYTSLKDFVTKYNLQYGGNLGVIVGRRSQLNFTYNMWSLSGNELFNGYMVAEDRVKGTQYGLTLRTFRKKRGGLAPIGKFYDVGLGYSQNKVIISSANPYEDGTGNYSMMLPKDANVLTAHVAFGSQMVFWDRVVGNTGLRFGMPLYVTNEGGTDFMFNRFLMKDAFSVFFGLGVLI